MEHAEPPCQKAVHRLFWGGRWGKGCAGVAGEWGDAFSRRVDGLPVRFVRPDDTERSTWAIYENERYLGTLHARPDGDGLWHVQSAAEQCLCLDDAVRVLRRPSSWSHQREQAARWARGAGRSGPTGDRCPDRRSGPTGVGGTDRRDGRHGPHGGERDAQPVRAHHGDGQRKPTGSRNLEGPKGRTRWALTA